MNYVKLTTLEPVLIGNYPDDGEDVLVELDATIAAFSVTIPDLFSMGKRVFMFKNLSVNPVTLNTSHSQIIDYPGIFTKVIIYKQFFSIASNLKDKWISLETNP